MSEHHRARALMLLALGLFLAACRPSPTPMGGELSLTSTPDEWMLTAPTTVELASGRPSFVWFFAPY